MGLPKLVSFLGEEILSAATWPSPSTLSSPPGPTLPSQHGRGTQAQVLPGWQPACGRDDVSHGSPVRHRPWAGAHARRPPGGWDLSQSGTKISSPQEKMTSLRTSSTWSWLVCPTRRSASRASACPGAKVLVRGTARSAAQRRHVRGIEKKMGTAVRPPACSISRGRRVLVGRNTAV